MSEIPKWVDEALIASHAPTADHDEVAEEIKDCLIKHGYMAEFFTTTNLLRDISAILARHYGREGK